MKLSMWCSASLVGCLLTAADGEHERVGHRLLDPGSVAWWTFDNHLRDEVHGLELSNTPNERKDLEEFYRRLQFVDDVPILRINGNLNWRGYYRWGVPSLTRGRIGDQLDVDGPFTIEFYLNPLPPAGRPPQHRTFVLRKNRLKNGERESQWRVELRRGAHNGPYTADIWVSASLQVPDGSVRIREVQATDAARFSTWQHVAIVYDGNGLSLLVDREQVGGTEIPQPGARLLPSAGSGELLVSALAEEEIRDKPFADSARNWSTMFRGRIDELRMSRAALSTEELLPLPCGVAADPLPPPLSRTEFQSLVHRHLDLLIRHGTDTYGAVHSPLIGSTLDPETNRMLKLKPPQARGMPFVGDRYRSPILGCNLTLLRSMLMTMRALSAITGEERYREHAGRALEFWLTNCPYPSGVWPVGEHGVWNFHTDKPEPKRPHEPQALLDWPRYWQIDADAVRKELELMHTIHVFPYTHNGKTLAFHGRHGSTGGTPHRASGCGFGRQSGLFARGWAFLYSKTRNPEHLRWAKDQLELMWELRDPKTDLCPGQVFPPPGSTFGGKRYSDKRGATTQTLWAAIGFLDAIPWLDSPEDRQLFLDRALTLAVANFRTYYKWDGTRFTDTRVNWNSSTNAPGGGWLLLKVWERAGRPKALLEQARHVADARMKSWLPCKTTDAGRYGWNIMFYVQLFNETGDRSYLDFARRLGDYAAANLVTEAGLIVGSCYYLFYDRMYHVPKLVQAFLALDYPKHPAVTRLLREPYF